MASELKKFYLGQYVIELIQYYISRRTMTMESIRWRRWPLGGIRIEKFPVIELLQYYLGGQQRGRPSDGEADHQVASGLKSFILGSA